VSRAFDRWRDPRHGLRIHHTRTRAGMTVDVIPMPAFRTVHIALGVRCGNADRRVPGFGPVPSGAAHFLEHRMFHTEAGDAFDGFVALGAGANAWTTLDATTYVVDAATHIEPSLRLLLALTATYVPDSEGVARERQIIAQEAAPGLDDPAWRGYFELLGALYRRHPVRDDIVGDVASLPKIDDALLGAMHRAFYGRRNQHLVVAGPVSPRAVLRLAEAAPGWSGRAPRRPTAPESARVFRKRVEVALPVPRPHALFGIKDAAPGGGLRGLHRHVVTVLAWEVLMADGGRLQDAWYAQGLIDEGFHAQVETGRDYGVAYLAADVDDPETFLDVAASTVRGAGALPVAARELERGRRRWIGRHLRQRASTENAAQWILGARLDRTPPGAVMDAIEAVTPRMITRRLRDLVGRSHAGVVIRPR